MSCSLLPETPGLRPRALGTRRRGRHGLAAGLCATALLASATACTSSAASSNSSAAHGSSAAQTSNPAPRGSAAAGAIRITGAYLPQPASADVAAVYLTVTDSGDRADVLVSASSTPAAQVALMRETTSAGAESMSTLTGGLPIPAHGGVALAPGGYHLMLTDPASPLVAGGTVTLALRFEHAGTVTLSVPITSLLSDAATAEATSMAGMPGM